MLKNKDSHVNLRPFLMGYEAHQCSLDRPAISWGGIGGVGPLRFSR